MNGIQNFEISHVRAFDANISGGDRRTLTAANHFVENNLIHDWGVLQRIYHCGIPINGGGTLAVHHEFYKVPHIATSQFYTVKTRMKISITQFMTYASKPQTQPLCIPDGIGQLRAIKSIN